MTEAAPAKIFVVDDDAGLLRLVERALKREGFATATASSGQDAIAWLTQNDTHLMLLDLKLQDIEGKELINHLASVGRSVPFIIITGQGDERVAVDMMKRGAMDYLVKDVRFVEFVPVVVRRALEELEKDRRLAAAQSALEESQKQILAISEREQRHFGAELHDGLGQQLTAIELMCQSLREDLRAARPALKKQITQICQFLRQAIAQTRSLARGLAPVNFGSRGLAEALDELASRTNGLGRVHCSFHSASPVTVEDDLTTGHLFRIAQEAVNNAVKHSRASEIAIRLIQCNGDLRLEILDNGQGFPNSSKPDSGIGLQVMKHRASVIGAALDIQSRAGQGVSVTCLLETRKP